MKTKTLELGLLLIAITVSISSLSAQDITKVSKPFFKVQNEFRIAIENNDFDGVVRTVDQGASVNFGCNGVWATPIMIAAYHGNLQIIKYLIEQGADYKQKGILILDEKTQSYYGNLMSIAAGQGNLELLRYFYEQLDIPIDDEERSYLTDQEQFILVNDHLDTMRAKAILSEKKQPGWTALQWASSKGHYQIVKYLLLHDAEINIVNSADKATPLILSILSKNDSVTKELIEKKADIFQGDSSNTTPLHYAAFYERLDIVKILIQKGVVIDKQNNSGITPLMMAIYSGNIELTHYLIDHGASKKILDNNRRTPLDYALMSKDSLLIITVAGRLRAKNYDTLILLKSKLKSISNLKSIEEKVKVLKSEVKSDDLINKEYTENLYKYYQLGILYQSIMKLDSAEFYFQKALQIASKFKLEIPDYYVTILTDISELNLLLGDYSTALFSLCEAEHCLKNISSRLNASCAAWYFAESKFWLKNESLDNAYENATKAASIFRVLYGPKNVQYLDAISLAYSLKFETIENSIDPLSNILNSLVELLGTNNFHLIPTMNVIGDLYRAKNKYSEAAIIYTDILKIAKSCNLENFLTVGPSLLSLAETKDAVHCPEMANEFFFQVDSLFKNFVENSFYSLTDIKKEYFMSNVCLSYLNQLNCHLLFFNSKRITSIPLNNKLFIDNMIFNFSSVLSSVVYQTTDTCLINRCDKLFQRKNHLLWYIAHSERKDDYIDKEIYFIDSIEKSIMQAYKPANDKIVHQQNTNFHDIQSLLGPDEAAVQMIRFFYKSMYSWDKIKYAAIIITNDTNLQPQMWLISVCL